MSNEQDELISATNSADVFRFIPFNRLKRSDKNMRTIHPENDPADASLLASIRAQGLKQNLVVFHTEGEQYEVPAGGRRFGSLEVLVGENHLPEDAPIPCLVVPKEEATNASLLENFQRKAPHPADTFTAFDALLKEGRSEDDIAKQYGISVNEVRRYLRLGRVNRMLFKHYKADRLSLDQIMAFATTPDTKLQLAIFKSLGENFDVPTHRIRRELDESRRSSTSAIARFVTVDAYIKAGGATEDDLFSGETLLCDLELVTRLAQQKLDQAATTLTGWGWVETSLTGYQGLYNMKRLPSETKNIPAERQAPVDASIEQARKLEDTDDADWTDELADELEAIEDRISELEQALDQEFTFYPDEDKPFAGCVVTFDQQTGTQEVYCGLMNVSDVKAYRNKEKKKGQDDAAEGTAISTESLTKATNSDLSSKLAMDLGLYRRAAIQATLASHPTVAQSILHFQLCNSVLDESLYHWSKPLDARFQAVSNETSIEDYESTKPAALLAKIHSKLELAWMTPKSTEKRYDAFCALSATKRNALVAYATAITLQSGDSLPGKDKFVDKLAADIDVDFDALFTPNSSNYFSRLTKPLLLTLGGKWFGISWKANHEKNAKKVLVEHFDRIFNGQIKSLTDKEQTIRSKWLPPQIRK